MGESDRWGVSSAHKVGPSTVLKESSLSAEAAPLAQPHPYSWYRSLIASCLHSSPRVNRLRKTSQFASCVWHIPPDGHQVALSNAGAVNKTWPLLWHTTTRVHWEGQAGVKFSPLWLYCLKGLKGGRRKEGHCDAAVTAKAIIHFVTGIGLFGCLETLVFLKS